jgi:TPR repeat protein
MYLSGVGVNQSFTKGFHLLSLAMEQGHSVATYMMGIVHLNGIGTVRDCSLATKLFRRVALKHSWVVKRLQKVKRFFLNC